MNNVKRPRIRSISKLQKKRLIRSGGSTALKVVRQAGGNRESRKRANWAGVLPRGKRKLIAQSAGARGRVNSGHEEFQSAIIPPLSSHPRLLLGSSPAAAAACPISLCARDRSSSLSLSLCFSSSSVLLMPVTNGVIIP